MKNYKQHPFALRCLIKISEEEKENGTEEEMAKNFSKLKIDNKDAEAQRT